MKKWIFLFVLLVMVAYREGLKNDTYEYHSNSCICEKLGPGLHPTFNSKGYCVCKIIGKDDDEIKEYRSFRRFRYCPRGMYFNQLILNCDYESEDYVIPLPPNPKDYKCPQENGKFRYPGQCHLFIHCSNNVPLSKPCPANLYFCESCKKQDCVYEHEADCPETSTGTDSDQTEKITTPFVTSDETQTITVPDSSTSSLPPVESFECPYQNGLLPDIRNCSQYWQCANKISHLKWCQENTYFDPVFRACSSKKSICKNGQPVNKEISLPNGQCCSNWKIVRDEQNCSKMFMCHNGNLFHESCGKGENFDGENQCLKKEEVKKCPKPAEILQNVEHCKACKTSECKVPDPKSPYHFYQCNGMKAKKFNCHLGQTFNSQTLQCELMKGNCE